MLNVSLFRTISSRSTCSRRCESSCTFWTPIDQVTHIVTANCSQFSLWFPTVLTGKVLIRDVVASKVMAELLALQSESFSGDKPSAPPAPPAKPGAAPVSNWFSSTNALRVYGQYLELDTDMNGMLSKEEMMGYGA